MFPDKLFFRDVNDISKISKYRIKLSQRKISISIEISYEKNVDIRKKYQ